MSPRHPCSCKGSSAFQGRATRSYMQRRGRGGGTVPPKDQSHGASHQALATGAGVGQPQCRDVPVSITRFLDSMLLLETFCLFGQRKALRIQKQSTRQECQEPWQQHPSPAPPGREIKPALPQAAALSSEKRLPARRGAAIFHICVLHRERRGQRSAETPRGYFLTKPCIAVSEKISAKGGYYADNKMFISM